MFGQPFLQWKISKYYILRVCVCSLRYPAWNAHAPYCHLWPVRLYYISPLYLKTVRFSRNVVEHKMCVLILSTTLSERFLIWRTERDAFKNVYRSSCEVPVIFVRFWHLNFLDFFFRKILKYKISWKCEQWEPSCSMRTDWHTDRTKLFAILRKATKNHNSALAFYDCRYSLMERKTQAEGALDYGDEDYIGNSEELKGGRNNCIMMRFMTCAPW